MAIRPLPQFEADLAEDRKIYEKLKPPTTMVVRFGIMRLIGEFPYTGDAKPGCGSKVVVRTHRGVELAEMLTTTCPNSGCGKSVSRHEMLEYIENSGGRDYPFFNQGKVLRIATMDDLNQQAKIDAERPKMVMRVREIMGEMMGNRGASAPSVLPAPPVPPSPTGPAHTEFSDPPTAAEQTPPLSPLPGASGGNTGGSAPGWLPGPQDSAEHLHDQSHQDNVGHNFAATERESHHQGTDRDGRPMNQVGPSHSSGGARFPQNMKVVDAEPILGNDRLTFYFASEDRVDFRDLVARLASEYRVRIEMRQVGARDEARLVADYERCGQQCCCKQFLKVLKPVSMRSAKIQKATLDPLKISGRCGRL
ncbi:MAG: hypothetical protein H7210_05755, partial [Pyrinomonadaceae bacterium]|nr:hypothetical protein [Phycisphaerales bacterium]